METPTPDTQALPAGTRLEEFMIERVLGSGGFGITYLARDTSLNRQVVIKENLPSQFVWRDTNSGTVRPRHTTGSDADNFEWSMRNFLREAETLASLDHPGIVRVLRMFEANGTGYFVMPFVQGVEFGSLISKRAEKGQPFTEEELRGLTERLLDALSYLHDRGIYHRDIKPTNILITTEGVPVLIDFGSARQRLSERSMTVVESAGYTPFEQLQSRGNVGPWSDLYAFGATLAKAITFETPPKAADRVMGDPWHGLIEDSRSSSLAKRFLEAIDRSMAVDPRSRWQNAKEWLTALNVDGSMRACSASQPAPPPFPTQVFVQSQTSVTARDDSAQAGNPVTSTVSSSQVVAASWSTGSRHTSANRHWEESYIGSHCPYCGQCMRFQMKLLKEHKLKCGSCGHGIVPTALGEQYPEDPAPYPIALIELLLSYRGRVGRMEFLLLAVFPFPILIPAMLILVDSSEAILALSGFLWIGWSIFVCFPITAKRLHDHGLSGYWILILLIPYLNWGGAIWFLVLLGIMPGTSLANRYGPPASQFENILRGH